MEELIKITNQSDGATLKKYFTKILELQASGEQFPVELDEVWPLIYSTKQNATRELKTNFLEGDDYHLMQNDKVVKINDLQNGVKYDCKLSVPCLEYFIVRKVRAVFEVYRGVFHAVAESPKQVVLPSKKELALMVVAAEEKIELLEAENKKLAPKAEVVDIILTAKNCYTTTDIAKELGMGATTLNKKLCEMGIQRKFQDHYVLYAKYQDKGYTETKTELIQPKNKDPFTVLQMVWTQRGRLFIHSRMNPKLSFYTPPQQQIAIA